jgi:hypothetical protein
MATKIFDVAEMVCEDIQAYVKSAKFCTGSDAAPEYAQCDDGAFVTLGKLCADSAYADMVDYNCKYAYAPTTDEVTLDDLWVTDIAEVGAGVIAGNTYRIGVKLVDLKVEAGYPVRVRKLKKGDMFWIGAGCFESLPTVGQFAIPTATKVTLTPQATAQVGKVNFAIRASKPMTIGTSVAYNQPNFEQEYLVEVL